MSNYKNKNINIKNYADQTQLVRGGSFRSNFGETSEAIFMNSGFCYNDAQTAEKRFNKEEPGYVYSRYSNPTLKMLEERLALLEGCQAACVMASGMAAVFASIMCQIKAGDHIVASRVLFGSCYHILTQILPNYNIEVSLIDGVDNNEWQKAFKSNTKLVFIETPANPNLEIIDIEFVANLCKKNNAKLIIDNIFASPFCQSPFKFGADIVLYSTTKHLDGQGRTIGGCVLGSKEFIEDILLPFHRHTGPAMSPFNSWIILKAMETFKLRMKQQCENAFKIAKFLEASPQIKRVYYPLLESHPQYEIAKKQMQYGSNLIAFEVKGSKDQIFNFMNNLKIIDISNNLGDSKSLITHPSSTTHSNISKDEQQKIGISQFLCRLSVGLEDVDDLINDINNALLIK